MVYEEVSRLKLLVSILPNINLLKGHKKKETVDFIFNYLHDNYNYEIVYDSKLDHLDYIKNVDKDHLNKAISIYILQNS